MSDLKRYEIYLAHNDRAVFIEKLKVLLTPFAEVFTEKDAEIAKLKTVERCERCGSDKIHHGTLDYCREAETMKGFRTTKHGIAICPYFTWQSENVEGGGWQAENDVNLTFCNHPDNSNDCEGNCTVEFCPLIKIKEG